MPDKITGFLLCAALVLFSGARDSLAADVKPERQGEWEGVIKAAKVEGEVVVYIYRYERVLEEFKKEYPEIKVISVTGTGAQLGVRLLAERRAGKYLADVFSSGATSYNVLYPAKALDPRIGGLRASLPRCDPPGIERYDASIKAHRRDYEAQTVKREMKSSWNHP